MNRAIPKAVRARWAGICASAATIALGWLADSGLATTLDGALYDRYQRASAATPVLPVTLVSIDGPSTGRIGPWPWSDEVLASLVDRLAASGTRVIAFATPLPGVESGNPALVAAMHAHGSVLLTQTSASDAEAWYATRAVGHTVLSRDPDGISRSIPAELDFDGRRVAALPLAIVARALDRDTADVVRERADRYAIGALKVPVDRGDLRPKFQLDIPGGAPAELPAWQVLEPDGATPSLNGRIVVIGHAGERIATPVAASQPLSHITAAAIASIMAGQSIAHPWWARALEWAAAIAVVALAGLSFATLGFWPSLAAVVLTAGALVGIDLATLALADVWIALAIPALAAITGWAAARAAFLDVTRAAAQAHRSDHGDSIRMLAETFQQQGRLELAFETLRQCSADAATLAGLYSIGLEYERTGQPGLAAQVFRHIVGIDPAYRDAAARLTLDGAADTRGMPSDLDVVSDITDEAAASAPIERPALLQLGRYEIERELGKGAMGVVYLGRDPRINRVVAIKAIALADEFEEADLAEAKTRFFREAEMAGRLNHPGIVTVYDVGEDGRLAFIAMERLRGQHLSHYAEQSQLLEPAEVLALGARVAEALHYAHQQNVVHRDIKPANIMFNRETDELKITDFGIARLTDTSRTKTGIVLGTPSFMSPEQLEGRHLDGRSDLFSLGVSLYQLLTGQLPFRAESMTRLMQKIASEPHPPVRSVRPELPDCIESTLAVALAKNPDDRFQTGAEFAAALRACAARLAA